PAAPTNVSATDTGDGDTAKVVITWVKSFGATDYHVWRDAIDLGASGDVNTENDNGADAPTVTPGTATASDGDSTAHTTLSIAGDTSNPGNVHVYKVVASNATGDSDDSNLDNGNRAAAGLTYEWFRSAGDGDAGYGTILGEGGTTDPYNDTNAPAPTITPGNAIASDGTSGVHVTLDVVGQSSNDGAGRWYYCEVSAVDAVTQDTDHNRGYRGGGVLSYEWFRSAADLDAAFGSIAGEGGTTDPYNDPNGAVEPDGRWYYCNLTAPDAANQDTTHNRGFIAAVTVDIIFDRCTG
ncbi:unnamed protein product, partial [marine sediment metagenome]